MTENYKAQVSIKFGPNMGGMLNLRADTVEELEVLVEQATAAIVKTGGLLEEAGALSSVGAQFPQAQVQAQPQQQAPQAQPQGAAQVCPHGSMTFRSGGAPGSEWKGYFCPADRNDPNKCKARYIR